MRRPVRRAPVEVDKDERYTTPETDALCRRLVGVMRWSLDAAACRESHLATRYYTKADDGLACPWFGATWCNPPWSTLTPWVRKAWHEMARLNGPVIIAMLVPGGRTEQPWWQKYIEPRRDRPADGTAAVLATHNLPGRQRFGHPGNATAADVGSPPFTATLLVWRRA